MATYEAVLDALGDGTRRSILGRLKDGPAAVSQLAAGLPVSRPAVSQHLRVLLGAGLVAYDEEGTRNIYRVEPDGLVVLRAWLDDFWATALERFETHARQRADDQGSRR